MESTPGRVKLENMTSTPGEQPASPPGTLAGGAREGNGTTPRSHPRLERNQEEAWIAGVASGLAWHLDWPIWLVRMCFMALTLTGFLGIAIYVVLWVVMPSQEVVRQAPGLEAASHQGMRPDRPRFRSNFGRIFAALLLVLGVILLVQSIGFGVSASFFGPAALAGMGLVLVWIQSDTDDEASRAASNAPEWLRPWVASRGIIAIIRVVLGAVLLGLAVSMLAASRIGVAQLPFVFLVAGLTVLGVGVVAMPWYMRYQRELNTAREAKLISDTRADMAAHLHDSVLQTLALIQRQSDDPVKVAGLARRQERELRSWLYGDSGDEEEMTFKSALQEAALAVDAERGVPVECVCVGDLPLDDDLRAMVQAAREAIMNAAKHSGAAVIDVYAEIDDDGQHQVIEVFIRDRGKGFNPGEIAGDRMGVRRSIIERMQRHNGHARIRSAPGEGTEIRLEMTR